MKPMNHGTVHAYRHHRCRCDQCTHANREYKRQWRERKRGGDTDDHALRHDAFADLLHELAPFGLTDDCPARRALR
jgi:hypothetical protein